MTVWAWGSNFLLPKLPQKVSLTLEVIKKDLKIIISFSMVMYVKHFVMFRIKIFTKFMNQIYTMEQFLALEVMILTKVNKWKYISFYILLMKLIEEIAIHGLLAFIVFRKLIWFLIFYLFLRMWVIPHVLFCLGQYKSVCVCVCVCVCVFGCDCVISLSASWHLLLCLSGFPTKYF